MGEVVEQSTSEREQEFEEKYREYRRLFYTTSLPVHEIMRRIGLSMCTRTHQRINRRLFLEDGVTAHKRGNCIRFGKWDTTGE